MQKEVRRDIERKVACAQRAEVQESTEHSAELVVIVPNLYEADNLPELTRPSLRPCQRHSLQLSYSSSMIIPKTAQRNS